MKAIEARKYCTPLGEMQVSEYEAYYVKYHDDKELLTDILCSITGFSDFDVSDIFKQGENGCVLRVDQTYNSQCGLQTAYMVMTTDEWNQRVDNLRIKEEF